MIVAKGLSKQIGGRRIVENVSLEAPDGHITGFLGPNGAGKTTTLRMLCGLIRPDRGHVTVDGQDLMADPDAARCKLGVLPDARGLYRRLTARENIAYFGKLYGMDELDIQARTHELSTALGLADFLDRRAEGFSQGERVRTALARAMIHRPTTLLLDEPSNGLDVGAQRALRAFLLAERAAGKAILISTHILSDVARLCDRVVVLVRGAVVAQGSPAELMARAGTTSLEDAFLHWSGTDEGWAA